MKKAMLFLVALLVSVSANAATLTLTNGISLLSGGPVAQNIQALSGTGTTTFNLKSDETTYVDFTIVENTDASVATTDILLDGVSIVTPDSFITGEWTFTALLTAGVSYTLSIIASGTGSLSATTAISAVPVPAALFLFAPALLGLMGLRRKTAVAA